MSEGRVSAFPKLQFGGSRVLQFTRVTRSYPRKFLAAFVALALAVPVASALLPASTPAAAADGYQVTGVRVNPSTLATKADSDNTCGFREAANQLLTIDYGDVAEKAPKRPDASNPQCVFDSAVYTANGYGLPIKSILQDSQNPDRLILVPAVTADEQADQDKVQLTLAKADAAAHILFRYFASSEAVRLRLHPVAESGGTKVVVDGEKLTGDRYIRMLRREGGGYGAQIHMEYPRELKLNGEFPYSVTLPQSDGTTNTIDFRGKNILDFPAVVETVSDTSTADTTIRDYLIKYNPTQLATHGDAVVNLSAPAKQIPISASTTGGMAGASSDEGNFGAADKLARRIPVQNCGDLTSGCANWYWDRYVPPFFYKVVAAGVPNSELRKDNILYRTGIPFNGGWLRSDVEVHNGTNSSYSGNPVAESDYPNYGFNASGDRSISWVANHTPAQLDTPVQPYNNKVEFYVENPGRAAKYMGLPNWYSFKDVNSNSVGPSNFNPVVTEQKQWTAFLGRVGINGEWYNVPLPDLNKVLKDVNIGDDSACGPDASGCSADMQWYRQARDEILGTNYSAAGNFTSGGYSTQCGTWNQPVVYKGKELLRQTITSGPNAGTVLTVRAVNARVQADERADGFSPASNHSTYSDYKTFDRNTRQLWIPAAAPANQLSDQSVCNGLFANTSTDPHSSKALSVQWKTMYKVTLENLRADSYNLQTYFDITSQGFVWNAGAFGVRDKKIEILSRVDDPTPEATAGRECVVESDVTYCWLGVGTDATASQAVVDKIKSSGDNIRFTLRDGFAQPQLTGSWNGQQVQLSAQGDGVFVGHYAKAPNESFTTSENVAFGCSDQVSGIGSCGSMTKTSVINTVGKVASSSVQVTSTPVNLPVIYMDGANAAGGAAASAEIVPEQYAAGEFKPALVNKYSAFWEPVASRAPIAPAGKSGAFTGYELYGVSFAGCTSTVTVGAATHPDGTACTAAGAAPSARTKLSNTRFFPGDAIDFRDAAYKFSNDGFDNARYDALWLVPTFDNTGTVPSTVGTQAIYYTAVSEKYDSDVLAGSVPEFTFRGAPGLRAESKYSPPQPHPSFPETYFYAAEKSVLQLGLTKTTVPTLRYVYERKPSPTTINKRWLINGVEYADGAQPAQFKAALQVAGQDEKFGEPTSHTFAGDAIQLTETTSRDALFPGCYLQEVRVGSSSSTAVTTTAITDANKSGANSWKFDATLPELALADIASQAGGSVNVSYSFKSDDLQRPLPAEVLALRDSAWASSAAFGSVVAAPAVSQTAVTVTADGQTGTWIFTGWETQAQVARGALTFSGTWHYVPSGDVVAIPYTYVWEDGADPATLPWSDLPALPRNGYRATNEPLPAAPTSPQAGDAVPVSGGGAATFAGWQLSPDGAGYVGVWAHPVQAPVRYEIVFTGLRGYTEPLPSSRAYQWIKQVMPADTTAAVGSLVRPARPESLVANVRAYPEPGKDSADVGLAGPDWPSGDTWGSFVFRGYDVQQATAAAGGVVFKARWEWQSEKWFNFVKLKNVSETQGIDMQDVAASVQREMQEKLDAAGAVIAPGAGWSQASLVPGAGNEISVADSQRDGRWVLRSLSPESISKVADVAAENRSDGTVLGKVRAIDKFGVHFAPVTASWEFVPNSTVGQPVTPRYAFVSRNPEIELPAAITAIQQRLNAAATAADPGTVVAAASPADYVITDGGYRWLFLGWDSPYRTVSGVPITFTGTWVRVQQDVAASVHLYQWAWEDGTVAGLPADELPTLPAAVLVRDGSAPEEYPAVTTASGTKRQLAQGDTWLTAIGKVRLAGASVQGGVVTLQLAKPTQHTVKFAYSISGTPQVNGQDVVLDGFLKDRLQNSLPADYQAGEGQEVSVLPMRNLSVNTQPWWFTPDLVHPNYNKSSYVFTGWDKTTATVGAGDVTFTAKFEYRNDRWWRGVKLRNVSLTRTAGGDSVQMPAEVQKQIALDFEPVSTANQTQWTSDSSTWTAPAWVGKEVVDTANKGVWVFQGFKWVKNAGGTTAPNTETIVAMPANNTFDVTNEFPKASFSAATDNPYNNDDNWVAPYGAAGSGTLAQRGDRNLYLQAEWKLRVNPTYTITNVVQCDSAVHVEKRVAPVKHGVDLTNPSGTTAPAAGTGAAPEASAFKVGVPKAGVANETADVLGDGAADFPGTDAARKADRQAFINGAKSITLMEQQSTAAPEWALQEVACESGRVNSVEKAAGTANVAFGLGQHADCTLTNTAAQLALFSGIAQQGENDQGVNALIPLSSTGSLAALPPSQSGLPQLQVATSTAAVTASRDNTRWVRPGTDYRIQAPATIGANKLVRFERYIGDAAPDTVSSSDNTAGAWQDLGAGSAIAAADASGAAVSAREVVLQPDAGELLVVRAVYAPADWRPELPLTGGNPRDWFIVLGVLAVFVGGAAAWWRRRRLRAVVPVA